jgi:hypothetical protein
MINVLGIMEPYHLKRLQRAGLIINEKLGPEIQYHGARQPFRINILDTFENGKVNHRDIWNIVSQKGILHTEAKDIMQGRKPLH